MILSTCALIGLVGLIVLSGVLLAAALQHPPVEEIEAPDSWKNYRFGFAVASLIFVAFNMEMIFMYPQAVVFAKTGIKAFLDMFIGLLSAGIACAWAIGGLEWEQDSLRSGRLASSPPV